MRILIANSHVEIVGGAESYLTNVIPGLVDRGHEIAIVHSYAPAETSHRIDRRAPVSHVWCLSGLNDAETVRLVARWKPDVVYTHGLDPVATEELLIRTVPSVFFAHGYLGTCISGRKCYSLPRFQVCSREFGLGCLALYGLRRCGGRNPLTAIRAWREQGWRNRLLGQYDHVLVASRHMRDEMLRNGVSSEKVTVAGLPVGDGELPIKPRSAHEGRIVMLSRLTDLKGGEYLISALEIAERLLNRPLQLFIVGQGSEEPRLRKLARGKNNVTFAGWLGAEQRNQILQQSDLLVVPSVWPEPFGLVGLEAAQFGVPAVAFDVGGISDWLINGESGELAPSNPTSPEGLASAIARALRDDAHYAKLSAEALRVSRLFTLRNHLCLLEQCLSTAMSKSASPTEVRR
jgi:glycosyltransferase involved in cell wall biosynthesis